MKSLVKTLLVIFVLTFSISGCAGVPTTGPAKIEIGQAMLDLPEIPRPQYQEMVQDEPLESELNSEIFMENITKLKDWAEKLFVKYEAARAQNTRLKELREATNK